ncbi:MAG: acyl-ACP--UDP-N-acetylglucosamine O-acyltransferase [Armatimonadetes bacterium]|nr:acyl-ACP--UDP-N-acetylglucosamine O-acyltransferase [Armatimonadota bacterium]
MQIHETAIVHPDAQLGVDVRIGPFCVIDEDTVVGDRCDLKSHVCLRAGTRLGDDCSVEAHAVLGGAPQDLKYSGERSFAILGNRNIIREYATVHRATGEGAATSLGDDNMLMAYAHVGHNSRLGSRIMISSYVGISGHVVIEDRAVVGGLTGIHQFVTIGKMAMIGGYSSVMQDVPPFMTAEGAPAKPRGVNVVGLRRADVAAEGREVVKQAFRLLYRADLNISQALERLEAELERTVEIDYLVKFLYKIREGTKGRQEQRAH